MQKTPEERFWAKVDKRGPDDCWEWTSSRLPKGYGRFGSTLAHRYVYELTHGREAAEGVVIRHTCDNPPCVNPAHLIAGTYKDNTDDMMRRGRGPIGARQGCSKLTEENVREIRARAAEGEGHQEIADRFGVTRSNVSAVVRRDRWSHVPPAPGQNRRKRDGGIHHTNAKLTADLVREIRAAHAVGETPSEIAARFRISTSNVSCIVLRKTWKNISNV